jgi:hypothetical protein
MSEEFCFVILVTGLNSPNTGKEYDDDDDDDHHHHHHHQFSTTFHQFTRYHYQLFLLICLNISKE